MLKKLLFGGSVQHAISMLFTCAICDRKTTGSRQLLCGQPKSQSSVHVNMVAGEHMLCGIRLRDYYGSKRAWKIVGMVKSSLFVGKIFIQKASCPQAFLVTLLGVPFSELCSFPLPLQLPLS